MGLNDKPLTDIDSIIAFNEKLIEAATIIERNRAADAVHGYLVTFVKKSNNSPWIWKDIIQSCINKILNP